MSAADDPQPADAEAQTRADAISWWEDRLKIRNAWKQAGLLNGSGGNREEILLQISEDTVLDETDKQRLAWRVDHNPAQEPEPACLLTPEQQQEREHQMRVRQREEERQEYIRAEVERKNAPGYQERRRAFMQERAREREEATLRWGPDYEQKQYRAFLDENREAIREFQATSQRLRRGSDYEQTSGNESMGPDLQP